MIGKKLNTAQGYDSHGRAITTVTILIEPNWVVQLRSEEKEGYKSAQVAVGGAKKIGKPLTEHIKKAGLKLVPKKLKEFNFDGEVKVGQEIRLEDVFSKAVLVDITGTSKGKGFAGVVKRHGFAGGPRTHGQSDRERAPGSIGATTTPGRVFKGTKMAGHMGAEKVKIPALEVIDIDKENNILTVRGSVPGPQEGLLIVERSNKKKKNYQEPEIAAVPALGKDEEKSESIEEKSQGVSGKQGEKEEAKNDNKGGKKDGKN